MKTCYTLDLNNVNYSKDSYGNESAHEQMDSEMNQNQKHFLFLFESIQNV